MRPRSFFFAFFAAFFSFAVKTATFFVSLLLFCPLLITSLLRRVHVLSTAGFFPWFFVFR